MKAAQHRYLTKLRGQGRLYQGEPVPDQLPEIEKGSIDDGTVDIGSIVREVLDEMQLASELRELEQMADEQRELSAAAKEDDDA